MQRVKLHLLLSRKVITYLLSVYFVGISLRNMERGPEWLIVNALGWVFLVLTCAQVKAGPTLWNLYLDFNSENARPMKFSEEMLTYFGQLFTTIILMGRFSEHLFDASIITGVWVWMPESLFALQYAMPNADELYNWNYIIGNVVYFVMALIAFIIMLYSNEYLRVQQRAYYRLKVESDEDIEDI